MEQEGYGEARHRVYHLIYLTDGGWSAGGAGWSRRFVDEMDVGEEHIGRDSGGKHGGQRSYKNGFAQEM